jgi:hypothetical protein
MLFPSQNFTPIVPATKLDVCLQHSKDGILPPFRESTFRHLINEACFSLFRVGLLLRQTPVEVQAKYWP